MPSVIMVGVAIKYVILGVIILNVVMLYAVALCSSFFGTKCITVHAPCPNHGQTVANRTKPGPSFQF